MQSKPYRGMAMEGRVARWYAANARKGLEEYKTLARQMTEGLVSGASVLEVAPGPGFFAIETAKLGKYKVTGLDISRTLVELARKNAREEGVEISFCLGNAAHMPFVSETFGFVFCRAAFNNFSEPVKALAEMRRVLRAGGKAVVIDLRRDASKKAIDTYVRKMRLGALNTFINKLIFRLLLVRRAYTQDQFRQLIMESGFQKFEIEETPPGFEISLLK